MLRRGGRGEGLQEVEGWIPRNREIGVSPRRGEARVQERFEIRFEELQVWVCRRGQVCGSPQRGGKGVLHGYESAPPSINCLHASLKLGASVFPVREFSLLCGKLSNILKRNLSSIF